MTLLKRGLPVRNYFEYEAAGDNGSENSLDGSGSEEANTEDDDFIDDEDEDIDITHLSKRKKVTVTFKGN